MTDYEKFQEWLNDCPTQIEDYKDNVDSVVIRFDMPSSEENDNEEKTIDYRDNKRE